MLFVAHRVAIPHLHSNKTPNSGVGRAAYSYEAFQGFVVAMIRPEEWNRVLAKGQTPHIENLEVYVTKH